MKRVDWSVITTGAPVGAIREMFEAGEQARTAFALGIVKNRIGAYSPSKVYVFGASDILWYITGDGDVAFKAPTGCLALYNNKLYSIAPMPTIATVTSYVLQATTSTTGITKDKNGNSVDIVYEDVLSVVSNASPGSISINDVVPLFMYDIVTDWVPIPAAPSAVSNLQVKRVGVVCYIRGTGTGNSSDQLGTVPGMFMPIANAAPFAQYFTVQESDGSFDKYYISGSLSNLGGLVVDGTKSFTVVNASYHLL